MATFTKADEIDIPQSVGPRTGGDVNLSNILDVFQPHQGRDLIYKNPKFNNGSTEITQSNDRRIPLGTYTLNNRDYWENNNLNESTFQPYLNEEWESNKSYRLKTRESITVETLDGNITVPVATTPLVANYGPYLEHNSGKFSVEALPFVINPNNDDIIHLDRYYDKEIDKENYELATEGKINLKLQANYYGRVPMLNPLEGQIGHKSDEGEYLAGREFGLNIDIFSERDSLSAGEWFDQVITANQAGETNGVYLFKLNWDDGSEIEYTDKPQLLEHITLFEHFYDKPGFYTISGVVYRVLAGTMSTWEKFQTNILLNPSPNYELNLFDYNNFASIGGISKDSAFVKSLYNIVGISPISGAYDNVRASEEVIEKLNTFDKIQILNVLGKVDYSILNDSLLSIISPYQGEIDDVDSAILGCTDEGANNYSGPLANVDDGSCVYIRTATISMFNKPYGTIGIEISKDGSVLETLSFSEDATPQYVEFDLRDNITITLTEELQVSDTGIPNELVEINDWFFAGWTFNDVDIGPVTAHPNILYESDYGEISDDFTLDVRFQYIDETPPYNVGNLTVHNREAPLISSPVTIPDYGQVGLTFDPSMSDDVDRYEIELFYTSLDVPIVVDTITLTAEEVDEMEITPWVNVPVSNLIADYIFKVTTYDTSENFSFINSGTIIPIVDYTVAPDPLTELNVQQIDRNILRFTWDQIDLSWPGIDGDFGHFELEIWNDNGETYTYNYSGDFATNDIIPNSFDFDASEIGSLFRYLGGGVIINSQSDMDNVNPDNPLSWDARIRVVDGTDVASYATEMDSIQPSRLIDPFGTVKLSIAVNGAHGTISVNDPNEIEPWGAYTILLTPFLNHDIIVSSNLGWMFGDINYHGNEDDGFTDYIVYDENSNNQTISISESFPEPSVWTQADYDAAVDAASAGNFMTGYPMVFTGGYPVPDESAIGTLNEPIIDKEGTLRVNWIELDEQSVISFPNNNSVPLVFDAYFVEPYVEGEPNEKVEITFDWDLSLLYNPDGTGHIAAGEEVQVRLTYIYDWNLDPNSGYNAAAQMFGGEDSIITINWDSDNLSGTETMIVNYVEDGEDQLESFNNFLGTTFYPEAFRLTFWKTNSEGMMRPFGTSGTLSGPTVYGSPEIQFNRATLGCIIDDTALNYNPNATEDDGSCIG